VTIRTLLWRRAPLALAALVFTFGAGSALLRPWAAPQPVSAPVTTSTTTSTTIPPTTTTAAPVPETVPEPVPEPAPEPAPAPARAPKPERQAPPPTEPEPAPPGTESETAQFISLINQLRADNGLDPLVVAGDATAKAKQHSDEMAASGQLVHSGSMSVSGWSAAGENIGEGSSVARIESAFESSGIHRANMLNPSYTHVGVGVSRSDAGRLYVTEVFVG